MYLDSIWRLEDPKCSPVRILLDLRNTISNDSLDFECLSRNNVETIPAIAGEFRNSVS